MPDSKSPLGKTWLEITREERYFCAELFFEIRKDINKFIWFLNEQTELNLNEDQNWEIGYEVCFYRDLLYSKKIKVRETLFPAKRTFDLCLFSKSQMIIIEAKAQEKFEEEQLSELLKDIVRVNALLKLLGYEEVDLKICLLTAESRKAEIGLPECTWQMLASYYDNNRYFSLANDVPKMPKPMRI